jgi:hypothetical protein
MNIHVIFKTHLDIGFTDLASTVTQRYMHGYIPGAIALAQRLRDEGYTEQFVWTTGAWLIYEFLEQAGKRERRLMEDAIARGDIAWHALPFTTHTELMDASLFRFGLSLSKRLDAHFGRETIASKMTDVPGHTRAMLPLLAEAGVQFLHLGANEASCPPDVPPVFVWRHTDGSEVVVMYHASYGGEGAAAGLNHLLYFAHSGDNLGPPAFQEVIAQFLLLSQKFPGAQIAASTLDAFARELLPLKKNLPVLTEEIGDTWIHGVATDPIKVSQYRALLRLREKWIAQGWKDESFSRHLMLVPEHTWGMDIKTHLNDHAHFSAGEVQSMLSTPRYKKVMKSWDEQRGYIRAALGTLDKKRLAEADEALRDLKPHRPDLRGFTQIDANEAITTAHFTLRFDANTGALTQLKTGRRNWASDTHPVGLLRYQTFSMRDFDRFQRSYNPNHGKPAIMWWSTSDFGKPGMEQNAPEHKLWQPQVAGIWQKRGDAGEHMVIQLDAPAEAHTKYGCPQHFTLEYTLPHAAPRIELRAQWFDKPATRMAEATWLSFAPITKKGEWHIEKMGEWIDPLDVVRHGNRTLHAASRGARYGDEDGGLMIDTPDAPLIAPGLPALLQFNDKQPSLRGGMHINLHNNVWGTNFPAWFGEDAAFRFVLSFD